MEKWKKTSPPRAGMIKKNLKNWSDNMNPFVIRNKRNPFESHHKRNPFVIIYKRNPVVIRTKGIPL